MTSDWHDTSWPSTKGMSVFNALAMGGAMNPEKIKDFLVVHWQDPNMTVAYVEEGILFLNSKGWIDTIGDTVSLNVTNRRVVRAKNDRDLALVQVRVSA